MLQTIEFQGGRQINAAATYFRYESGSAGGASEQIRVRADGNDIGTYMPGDHVELPFQCSTWEIIPVSPQAVGVVRLGVGRVGSARTSGVVRVIDSERDKVASGVCFRLGGNIAGGTGGPVSQIFNPAGSGKNLFVQAVRIGSTAVETWSVAIGPVVMPSIYANLPANMDTAGPAAIGVGRYGTTDQIMAGNRVIVSGNIGASQDVVVLFPRPIMLRPGNGAMAYTLSSTTSMRTGWEWEEWPA